MQTDRHTDMLCGVLCKPARGKVTIHIFGSSCSLYHDTLTSIPSNLERSVNEKKSDDYKFLEL